MSIYCDFIKILFLVYIAIVQSAPINDDTIHDQGIWHEMFVRRFFNPFNLESRKDEEFNDYEGSRRNLQNLPYQNDGTFIAENTQIYESSNRKQGISDFGAGYGIYPIGLAIFTDGVRSSLVNQSSSNAENGNLYVNDDRQ